MARLAIRLTMLTLVMMTVCVLPARADYQAGQAAWAAGRPAEALTAWRAAADTGDARAMLALGRLYAQGLGAPQDYVLAHMWFNLAASRGEAAALKARDALSAKMDTAAGSDGAGPRARLAVGWWWRPEDRRRAAGRSAAAVDPGGAGIDDGPWLQARSGRRPLGKPHGAGLCGVPARRRSAADEDADAVGVARHARARETPGRRRGCGAEAGGRRGGGLACRVAPRGEGRRYRRSQGGTRRRRGRECAGPHGPDGAYARSEQGVTR